MKRLLLFPFLLVLLCSVQAQQRAGSTIREVTVYLQGAQITRTAEANLQPGTQEVIFEGLSNFIDANSISVEGEGRATILAVNYRLNYLKYNDKTDEEQKLSNALDTAQKRLSYLLNEKAGLQEEMQMLIANRKIQSTEKGAFVDDLQDAADFFRSRVKEVNNKLTDLAPTEKKLQEKVNELQAQLTVFQNNNRKPSGEIVVTMTSSSYDKASFTLRYFVSQAGWIPKYNLRARGTDDKVSMDYDALVTQQTGEFWKNVKLTLSSGNPSLSGTAPVFNPLYADYMQQWNYGDGGKQRRSYKKDGNVGYEDEKPSMQGSRDNGATYSVDGIRINSSSDYTALKNNPTNFSFEIGLKYDIPSDAQGKYVRMQQYSLPAQFSYIAIPRMDADAFLQARVTGWDEYNLLPGEASIFLGDAFVGKSYIDPTTTSDTLNVSFGRDKRINIKRTRVKEVTKKQFLGSNKIETFGYVISIRNTKDKPVELMLIDQIPVSKQKDIEVELTDKGKADYDPATGKLSWSLNIKPADTETLKFEYKVKYPKNQSVTGLY